MASTIRRKQTPVGRSILVEFTLIAKDAADTALIAKFGDITIDPSGDFNDPNDNTFPAFNVSAGDPVLFFTDQAIRATFVDDTLEWAALQRKAELWGDQISLNIQNAMTALRALDDDITLDTTITI